MSTEIAQLVEVCLLRERVLELTAERDALTTACDAAHQALDDLTAERDAYRATLALIGRGVWTARNSVESIVWSARETLRNWEARP